MKTIAVILTGGMSRRMGRDKGTILFENGETLIARLVRRYGAEFDGVYVSVNEAGRFDTAGAPELVDLRPGQGPMAGLEAAFARTDADLVFLTAVDLPFGTPALARELDRLRAGRDACYIRRSDGRPEPLFALYARTCQAPLTACLEEGRRSFRWLFDRIDVREVWEEELEEFDLDHLLLNVNRPEDLMTALEQR